MEKLASESGSPPLLKEEAGACVNVPGVAWKFPKRVRGHCCAHVHHLAGWSQRWSALPLAAGSRHLSAFWEMPRGTPFLRLQTLSCSDLPRHLKFHSGDCLVGGVSCPMSVHCWRCQRTHQTMAVTKSSVWNSASCSRLRVWKPGAQDVYVLTENRSGVVQGRGQHTMACGPSLAGCLFGKWFYWNPAMPLHPVSAAFMLQWPSWVIAIETIRPAKNKILYSLAFYKKSLQMPTLEHLVFLGRQNGAP